MDAVSVHIRPPATNSVAKELFIGGTPLCLQIRGNSRCFGRDPFVKSLPLRCLGRPIGHRAPPRRLRDYKDPFLPRPHPHCILPSTLLSSLSVLPGTGWAAEPPESAPV